MFYRYPEPRIERIIISKLSNKEATHYTAFTDEHGGYHAGNYGADELPADTAFLIGEGSQTEVDDEFAKMTGITAIGGSSVAESLRDGARAVHGDHAVVGEDWGITHHNKTTFGSRHNHGRKPVTKK